MVTSTTAHKRYTKGATLVSWLFHPFIVSVITLFIATYLVERNAAAALLWVTLSFVVVILPAILFIGINIKRGRYTEFDVSMREQRHALYGLGIICFGILVLLLHLLNAPPIVLRCLYAGTVAIVTGAAVNRVTKVSIHALTIAGCTTVLGLVAPPVGAVALLVTLVVGWARIHLQKHTLIQVVLGWLIAGSAVWIVFIL